MKKFALSASVITLRSIPASIAVLFLVLVAGQSLTAQEKFTLKSGYAPGIYERIVENNYDGTAQMMGMTAPQKVTQKHYFTLNAEEKDADGTQKVVTECTRDISTITVPHWSNKYDSAVNPTFPDWYGSLFGLKITTVYDQDGNPVKSEGGEEHFNKMKDNNNYQASKATMTDEESGLIIADPAFMQLGVLRFKPPKVPVAIGEKWKSEVFCDVATVGKHKVNVENTLTEVKTENGKKVATILMKLEAHSKEPIIMAGATNTTVTNMNLLADANVTIDLESGMVLKSITDAVADVELDHGKIKGSGKMKTTVTLTPKQ